MENFAFGNKKDVTIIYEKIITSFYIPGKVESHLAGSMLQPLQRVRGAYPTAYLQTIFVVSNACYWNHKGRWLSGRSTNLAMQPTLLSQRRRFLDQV